jgi:predicted aspartyl protease
MRFLRRLRYWLRLSSHHSELIDELAFHREMIERDLIERGMSPADARAQARRTMGNETSMREQSRAVWLSPALEGLWQDATYALRDLRRHPTFALGVVVTLALVDTGAALSCFSSDVLRALHVRPLKLWHFRRADGTVVARWTAEVRVFAGGTSTIDEVVIGEPGDLVLLGARSLEGLNLRVDPVSMRLVDAGPAPAAVSL